MVERRGRNQPAASGHVASQYGTWIPHGRTFRKLSASEMFAPTAQEMLASASGCSSSSSIPSDMSAARPGYEMQHTRMPLCGIPSNITDPSSGIAPDRRPAVAVSGKRLSTSQSTNAGACRPELKAARWHPFSKARSQAHSQLQGSLQSDSNGLENNPHPTINRAPDLTRFTATAPKRARGSAVLATRDSVADFLNIDALGFSSEPSAGIDTPMQQSLLEASISNSVLSASDIEATLFSSRILSTSTEASSEASQAGNARICASLVAVNDNASRAYRSTQANQWNPACQFEFDLFGTDSTVLDAAHNQPAMSTSHLFAAPENDAAFDPLGLVMHSGHNDTVGGTRPRVLNSTTGTQATPGLDITHCIASDPAYAAPSSRRRQMSLSDSIAAISSGDCMTIAESHLFPEDALTGPTLVDHHPVSIDFSQNLDCFGGSALSNDGLRTGSDMPQGMIFRGSDPFVGMHDNSQEFFESGCEKMQSFHSDTCVSVADADIRVTPRFARSVARRAAISSGKAFHERQYYDDFVQRILAPGAAAVHSEDDDDDDIFQLQPGSEDTAALELADEPTSIPVNELFDLFDMASCDDDLSSQVVLLDYDLPAKFDDDCCAKISRMLAVHWQLLVQSLALSGEIKNADQIWLVVLKLMVQLESTVQQTVANQEELGAMFFMNGASIGFSLLLRILHQSPLHSAIIQGFRNLHSDSDLRLRSSVATIPFDLKHVVGPRRMGLSQTFWHVMSLFSEHKSDPAFELAAGTLGANASVATLIDHCAPGSVYNKDVLLSKTKPSNHFQGRIYLDSQAERTPWLQAASALSNQRITKSSACEDELLLLGLERFGTGNWEMIQAHYVPSRTAKQLAIRTKNLTTRRAPMNPVKDFCMRVATAGPLSRAEQEVLIEGVRMYRTDWHNIQRRFLPNRPVAVLQRMWAHIQSMRAGRREL